MASLCEITPMRRKKKALRDPPGPTLDTLRSFLKPAPNLREKHEKNGSNGTIPPSPQNERVDLVVLGL
nr:small subunit ribosomal protein S12 [Ipomoea batatas]GMD87890.1 small subunit ribosomal protein S12 [Ipomoea batatas]GMD96873.1 small subunit ribosomal protein S12 [Ipomoea batatas]